MGKTEAKELLEAFIYDGFYERNFIKLPEFDAIVVRYTDEKSNTTEYTFKGLLKIVYDL